MKKILSLIIILALFFNSAVFADSKYQEQVNMVSNKIEKIMLDKTFNKIYIYISMLENTKPKVELKISYFINDVINKLKSRYHRNNTNLILRVDKNYSNKILDNIINKNKINIKNSDNIFIFKNNATWLFSASQMKLISSKLKEVNPKIRILIDQEWWLVNRFKDFDKNNTFDSYINSSLSLKYKYAVLSEKTKSLITIAFKNRTTFISMDKIWEIYYSINKNNLSERNRFLDFITFFRLYTLHKNWINSHWIVCDLDKWNPVITWYDRSFSDDVDDYTNLWNYFIKNARILWISLYLKHFPWHGRWNIDTHKAILEYSNNKFDKKYVFDNMRVFEKIAYNARKSWIEIWIMTAHVILPNTAKNKYLDILKNTDYIMTDDLWMSAYIKLKDKKFTNKFFSTNEILSNFNTIRVYTKENEIK